MSTLNLPQMLMAQVATRPKAVALRHHELGRWKTTTWAELSLQVAAIASGFTKLGVGLGTRIALVGPNHPTMVAADLAALTLGAITVPIDAGLSPVTLTTLLRKTAAEYAFVGDQEQFDKIGTDPSVLAGMKTIIIADTRGMHDLESTVWSGGNVTRLALSQLISGGADQPVDLADIADERHPEDPATVDVYAMYGSPIETMVRTHSELAMAGSLHHPNLTLRSTDELLAVLSMARPRERALSEVAWLQTGAVLNLGIGGKVESLELRQVQPTVVQLDAKRLETMCSEIVQRVGAKGIRSKFVAKSLGGAPAGISRSSLRDVRTFRALGVGMIALWIMINNTLRSMYGLGRVVLCVAVTLVIGGVALASGVAIRPFMRKAYGFNRARHLVAFEVLPAPVVTLFSGLHLAPTEPGNLRSTPLSGTDLSQAVRPPVGLLSSATHSVFHAPASIPATTAPSKLSQPSSKSTSKSTSK